MRAYVLIAVLFIALACRAEGKRRKNDQPPSQLVTCVRDSFHKLIDTVGSVNISSPVTMFFGKKTAKEPSRYDNDKDAFIAVCNYYKDKLGSEVKNCGEPKEKADRRSLLREMHLVQTMDTICVDFYDELLENWNCIVDVKKAAPSIEACKSCETSCDPLCLENCVSDTAKSLCGTDAAIELMKKIAIRFSRKRIAFITKMSEDEKHKDQLSDDDKNCIEQYKVFLKETESETGSGAH